MDGRALCTAIGNQSLPAIVEDGAHGAVVCWQDARGGASTDIYAQHVLANGAVDPQWPGDGRALCTAANAQSSVAIAKDGAGGAIASWADFRANASESDIYAQHVEGNGLVDPLWPTDGSAVCTVAGVQTGTRLMADGAGGAIITWTDVRTGSQNGDIYAGRVRANGQLGGTVVGVPRQGALALALDAVRPNPWRGGALTLSFSLTSGAAASLEVVDIAGRRVATREFLVGAPGRHTTTLDLGRHLAPGIYLVRLRQAAAERTQRFAALD
jgi:hypothetical protein